MQSGWDPEVKTFLKKIITSISLGLIWMLSMLTLGLYHGFAWKNGRPVIFPIIFYIIFIISLLLVIRYLYKLWKKN